MVGSSYLTKLLRLFAYLLIASEGLGMALQFVLFLISGNGRNYSRIDFVAIAAFLWPLTLAFGPIFECSRNYSTACDLGIIVAWLSAGIALYQVSLIAIKQQVHSRLLKVALAYGLFLGALVTDMMLSR
jgi:hypothetical protein